jgi:hypothetical protein
MLSLLLACVMYLVMRIVPTVLQSAVRQSWEVWQGRGVV